MSIDAELEEQLGHLTERQMRRVQQLVGALVEGTNIDLNANSDFATQAWAQEFGDHLRLHHQGSAIPLTKDKFEYAMVDTFRDTGRDAAKLGNGNPGADITVDGSSWSLKTEAAAAIKADRIHISKAMELGKGAWETEDDIAALRDGFLEHLNRYERIMTLRCLERAAVDDGSVVYQYELVEIPKTLLKRCANAPIEIQVKSAQNPKPAYCRVLDEAGGAAFDLYFDGGTERKLQIKSLWKRNCVVHATWSFTTKS